MDRMLHWLGLLREYAKDYVLEHTGLKVLALLITGVLWLSVASRPVNQITIHNVPVEFRNLPDSPELAVSTYEPASLAARVYLTGPRDALDTIRANELIVYADFADVEPGVRVLPLQLDRSRLPASIEPRGVEPRNMRVTVEPVIEIEVPVIPRFEGEPPPGYEVLNWHISPATVHLAGAASQVRNIKEVSTETVTLGGKTHTFSQAVAIDIGSTNVNIRDEFARKPMLTVSIGEKRKERTFDQIRVKTLGQYIPQLIRPQTVQVRIAGPQSVVDMMTEDDISVVVEPPADERLREVAPRVVFSDAYSDRVTLVWVEPQTVRIK